VLAEAEFDEAVEMLCQPSYKECAFLVRCEMSGG
jgi:hypothetical protein